MYPTHMGIMANDVRGRESGVRYLIYAPCDIVCKKIYPSTGQAMFQSKRKVRLKEKSKLIEKFTEVFNIDNEKDKKLFDKSLVYLYVNFSNSDNSVILDAIDDETIIIVGNTYLFDDYHNLKDKLVLKSDDDINEISKKIEDAFKYKDKIISEYKKFRKDYIINS